MNIYLISGKNSPLITTITNASRTSIVFSRAICFSESDVRITGPQNWLRETMDRYAAKEPSALSSKLPSYVAAQHQMPDCTRTPN